MKGLLIVAFLLPILVFDVLNYFAIPLDKSDSEKISVTFPKGASLTQIADSLQKQGLIEQPKLFVFWAKTLGYEKKIRAGAEFIQTQPVFDLDRFNKWMDGVRKGGLHEKTAIIAGVMPVKSDKALHYMKKEVPGVRIEEDYIRRMSLAEDPKEEGVKIAVEIINELRRIEGVKGIHLMPVMWESITPTIVQEAGL